MMRRIRARRSNLKSKKCRLIKMRTFSLKATKQKGRRVFAPMENLDNLSVNTRRFLSRSFMTQKWNDDESRIRKLLKPLKRRSSGNSSVSSDTVNNVLDVRAVSIEREMPTIIEGQVFSRFDGDQLCISYEENCSDPLGDSTDGNSSKEQSKMGVETSFGRENENSEEDNDNDSIVPETSLCKLDETENQSCSEEHKENLIRTDDEIIDNVKKILSGNKISEETSSPYSFRTPKCKYCRESNESVVMYAGPPSNSKTEIEIQNEPALKVWEEDDDRAEFKLTEFSAFDKAGHLCPFDGDLIQNNVKLYFSGYVKPIYEDNPSVEGGYPCEKMGPMTEWWIAGFDEGEKAILGFSSELADYYLLNPTQEYAQFMETVTEKISVTKMVIEFLQSKTAEEDEDITYEDLLEYLESRETPTNTAPFEEKKLIAFADFIYDHVLSYESTAEDDEQQLNVNSACMKKLAELGGIRLEEKAQPTIRRKRAIWGKRKDPRFIKATTTPLVGNIFDSIFNDQLKQIRKNLTIKPCAVRLTRLENLHRYSGSWKINCNLKTSENDMSDLVKKSIQQNIIKECLVKIPPIPSDLLEKLLNQKLKMKKTGQYSGARCGVKSPKRKRWQNNDPDYKSSVPQKVKKLNREKILWQSQPEEIDERIFYSSVTIGKDLICTGNFVSMLNDGRVGLIKYMWQDDDSTAMCHVQWFLKRCDTILGDVGTRQELFLTEECVDIKLAEIDRKLNVDRLTMGQWPKMAAFVIPDWLNKNGSQLNRFYYQKSYKPKSGRFQDLPIEEKVPNTCANCGRKRELENREIPLPIGRMIIDDDTDTYTIKTVRWRDQTFTAGSCVFLSPGKLIKIKETTNEPRSEKYDELEFPEKYRKKFTNEVENNREHPFDVAYICRIFSNRRDIARARDVRLAVKKFYRPHQTHMKSEEADVKDLNLLYWSEDECEVKFDLVKGKCFVSYEKNVETTVADWSAKGPYRFYFTQTYDRAERRFTKPSRLAMSIGDNESENADANVPDDWPSIPRPLRTLDVFAGCGGLSEGLHQSGVARCLWAIEKFKAPAKAFELNNPDAKVFVTDCNELLQRIMDGKDKDLPKRGDVELLCGGPPCQGFSRMNRFKEGDYSKYKNSLITTYLSYCDHFRPRFFILENVRDFVSTDKNTVFKMSLSCLVRMGYQVDFGVLQCGKYGIPQSRRRTIILAAAPGEILPSFPEPTHSFPLNTFLDVAVNGIKYVSDIQWTKSAPYRGIIVSDALSDLPKIGNNDAKQIMTHINEPLTHFQKMVRGEKSKAGDKLRDHLCKNLAPLILKRISYIPREPAGDWRDLPNIEVKLSDGKRTNKLVYTHHDSKNGKSPKGRLRGVCPCATSTKRSDCTTGRKQGNTLIPWCLPHTGNRHNHWSGLYGRIGWNSYFRTVVTNPEPMGKQGRVLHPEQDRVVSIRECARSQGFADSFQFAGDILDKYAQIGNAVAPPLAKAIGLEIRKSIAAKIKGDS